MRQLLVVVLALVGFVAPAVAGEEPADLTPPGRETRELERKGWKFLGPVAINDPGLPKPQEHCPIDGQLWLTFYGQMKVGDQLVAIRNNAGIGYAIVRDGKVIDQFLNTIF